MEDEKPQKNPGKHTRTLGWTGDLWDPPSKAQEIKMHKRETIELNSIWTAKDTILKGKRLLQSGRKYLWTLCLMKGYEHLDHIRIQQNSGAKRPKNQISKQAIHLSWCFSKRRNTKGQRGKNHDPTTGRAWLTPVRRTAIKEERKQGL